MIWEFLFLKICIYQFFLVPLQQKHKNRKTMTAKELYEKAVEGGYENKELVIDCESYAGIERAPYEPSVIDDEVYI